MIKLHCKIKTEPIYSKVVLIWVTLMNKDMVLLLQNEGQLRPKTPFSGYVILCITSWLYTTCLKNKNHNFKFSNLKYVEQKVSLPKA